MKFRFQPMPFLTVVTAICISILIGLGTWQYQRLQWKRALLTEIEASVSAPPLTSLSQLKAEITAGNPVEFRRIGLRANVQTSSQPYFVYQPRQDGIYWRAFSPLFEDDILVFGAFGVAQDKEKENYDISYLPSGEAKLAGYVRRNHPMGRIESWVKSAASPEANRYFKFNQTEDWDKGGRIETGIYLDLDSHIYEASNLPIKRPDIRNNHFDYMLTWYSFAVIMLIIYMMMHYRNGRIKWS